jgi:hypothetical protein
MIPRYSQKPLHRTHAPVAPTTAERQRNCLRLDFDFRCVYCLTHESEAAPGYQYGAFEIEHFKPKGMKKFRGLRHTYSNLLWSCQTCNRAKGIKWPAADLARAGFRFVDPSTEGLGKHLFLTGLDTVAHQTKAGEYIVRQLNLNSPTHKQRRQRRNDLIKRFELARTIHDSQVGELERLRKVGEDSEAALKLAEVLGKELEAVLLQVAHMSPFDASETCNAYDPPRGRANRSQ